MKLPPFVVVLAFVVRALPVASQQLPPIHLIDRPIAETAHDLGGSIQIRALSNHGLLINDPAHRRLIRVDSSLRSAAVVTDTSPGRQFAYGASAVLLGYVGDSSILLLPRVPSMFVLDGTGAIVHVSAVPRPQDAGSMAATSFGTPGFDAKHRMIYRGATARARRDSIVPGGPPGAYVSTDTAPLVRFDADSHTLDTIALYRIHGFKGSIYPTKTGTMTIMINDVLHLVDDWTVMPDGSVAILRGQDYHFDVVSPDGSMTKWPKMSYAWEHLSDDAKVALVDSVKARDAKPDSAPPRSLTNAPATTASGGGSSGGAGSAPAGFEIPADAPRVVRPDELPDYRPPFETNALRADADGNLWIRTTLPGKYGAGAVYDVTRQGKVIDRVQLQPGRVISGFAPGGVVYMYAPFAGGGWIEKAVWHASRS